MVAVRPQANRLNAAKACCCLSVRQQLGKDGAVPLVHNRQFMMDDARFCTDGVVSNRLIDGADVDIGQEDIPWRLARLLVGACLPMVQRPTTFVSYACADLAGR